MEIGRDQGSTWVLHAWDQTSVLRFLISPTVGEVGRALARIVRSTLASPVRAIVTVSIAMVKDVVTASRHMVDDGVGIDSDTSGPACLDHVFELLTSATTALELVRGGLVVEPPWVELTVLGPLIGED